MQQDGLILETLMYFTPSTSKENLCLSHKKAFDLIKTFDKIHEQCIKKKKVLAIY